MIIIIEEEIPPSAVFHCDKGQAKFLIPADKPLELLGTVKAEKLIVDTRSDYESPSLETSEWIAAFISKARAMGIPIESHSWAPPTEQEAWESLPRQVDLLERCFTPGRETPDRALELLELLERIESNLKSLAEPPERWETGATLLAKIADLRDELREMITPPGAA